MFFMNCTISTVRVYQALVKSMLWGSSRCWKDKHFCNGRKWYTLQIVYLTLRMQIIVSYFLSVHTVFVFVCAPQVQPVEGGECRRVWGSCKEGCSLQCVSTSRWAASCFEIRPVSLVPIWDGKRSGMQDLPHNVKTYTYVRDLCLWISFKLQWRVRVRILFLSVSFICQVQQRLTSVEAVFFVTANISVTLTTSTTSVHVTGTATNTPAKPCPLRRI